MPGKGIILARLSAFWFELIEAHGVKTHFLGQPDSRTFRVQKLRMIPVELVVRGYLAGSMLKEYREGKRVFSGQTVPDGLQRYQKLDKPLITPTTKAAVYSHDEETSAKEIIASGVLTQNQWRHLEELSLKIFSIGSQYSMEKGLILVDTKYEFGFNSLNEVVLGDEVHTPDSSRFWESSSYVERVSNHLEPEMFDKQIVRNWLLKEGYSGQAVSPPKVPRPLLIQLARAYLDVSERLLGRSILR